MQRWFLPGAVVLVLLTLVALRSSSWWTPAPVAAPSERIIDLDVSFLADTCDVDPSWHETHASGKVVAFMVPGKTSPAVARVVARSGDTVGVRRKSFEVNGRPIPRNRRSVPAYTLPSITVPRDCVYVLVDASEGTDSMECGPIPYWRILGEVKP
jgi:hypothetical protein